jgi:hypothetical protein
MKRLVTIPLFLLGVFNCLSQTTETIKAGSYIINMGVVPQTVANGLKPYGLVYDLLKTYKIPVKWVINTTKAKDGIDFTHNGTNYSGGTFIIPYEYRTPTVNSTITSWESQGVVGQTSVSDFTATVYRTFHHPPVWTMDKANGSIAAAYFTNAGIPSTAYGGSSSSSWKDPSQLTSCDDIFVLPHADPTWTSHNYLYYWNLDQKGNIWSGCHSVSEMENVTNPGNTIQMNFLSTTGLIANGSHSDGSLPFNYNNPADPVMQFVGIVDGATNNGSERIYLPKSGGGWRPTTSIGVYDATHANVPSLSPGPAAVIAYGRGFGSSTRGWVMYEGGHNHNSGGTVAERVAAQRAFFNFSFFTTSDKNAWFDVELNNVPETLVPNSTITITFTLPSSVNLNDYTVQWSSSCGGSFSSTGNPQSINYTAPGTSSACVITANLVNACNREVFASKGTYLSAVLPVSVSSLAATYLETSKAVELSWENSSNEHIGTFIAERSENGHDFTPLKAVTSTGYAGRSLYSFKDEQPLYYDGYYRLKILSRSGATKYSNIVKVNTKSRTAFSQVVSDLSDGKISFQYFSETKQVLQFSLTDLSGRKLSNRLMTVKEGRNSIKIEAPGSLTSGIYLLRVSDGDSHPSGYMETFKVWMK